MESKYTYSINKGVGKTVEFKGLKAQYLVMFFVGVFVLTFLVVILAAIGMNFIVIACTAIPIALGLLYYVFSFNNKYGEHGLMKLSASRKLPRYLSRISISKNIISH